MSDNASLKIWQTLQPMVRKEVSKGTESSVKSKKMVVTTAYNASTKTVGVTEAFGKEIQVPVAGMINPDRLLVGTSVWVIALHGSWSNAMVCMLGDGQIPPAAFAPVNLLDNSDFRNPVNQRGGTSHTASENTASYWLDRWQFGRGTAALVDGGLSIVWNGNTSYGTNAYFRQTLGTALDVGKTYTLAVKVDGQIEAYSFINPSDDAADLYFKTNVYRVQIDSNKRTFVFYNYTTTPKVFEWAALYEGEYTAETVPPYVPKGYAAELAECMRYFQRINFTWAVLTAATPRDGTTTRSGMLLPQPMRMLIPTASYSGSSAILISTEGNKAITELTPNVRHTTLFITAKADSVTAGMPYAIYGSSGAEYIDISADL